jgi:hypothetical protein
MYCFVYEEPGHKQVTVSVMSAMDDYPFNQFILGDEGWQVLNESLHVVLTSGDRTLQIYKEGEY